MSFQDNADMSRFEYEQDGHTAFANYRKKNGVLHIDYVEAPEALRGTGAAGKLMSDVMDTARREKLKVIPLCGYAASWIKRHEEYADLLG
jgi:predicted GNAT family acetyltransferase